MNEASLGIEVSPCAIGPEHTSARLTFTLPTGTSPFIILSSISVVLHRQTGAPRPDAIVVSRLQDMAHMRQRVVSASLDPLAKAWISSRTVATAIYDNAPPRGHGCLEITSDSGGLHWCVGQGVLRYSVTSWERLARPELSSLAAVVATRDKAAVLKRATLTRGPGEPRWAAVVELTARGTPLRVHASQRATGWQLDR